MKRQTVVVVRSAPQVCVVCAGDQIVHLTVGPAPVAARAADHPPATPCPHCGPAGLPAIYLPWLTETYRGGAA